MIPQALSLPVHSLGRPLTAPKGPGSLRQQILGGGLRRAVHSSSLLVAHQPIDLVPERAGAEGEHPLGRAPRHGVRFDINGGYQRIDGRLQALFHQPLQVDPGQEVQGGGKADQDQPQGPEEEQRQPSGQGQGNSPNSAAVKLPNR